MPKKKRVKWKDKWPCGNEEELLLRYAAFLHHKELEEEFSNQAPEQPPLETPELDARIDRLLKEQKEHRRSGKSNTGMRRILVIALITIFTLLAIPTFLFAVSPQFRQVIHGFSIEWKDDHIELFSVIDGSSSASKDKEAQSPFYAPTYLPEGFELTDIQ